MQVLQAAVSLVTHTINHSQSQGQLRFKKRGKRIYLLTENWQSNTAKKHVGWELLSQSSLETQSTVKCRWNLQNNPFIIHHIGKSLKVNDRLQENRHYHILQVGVLYWYRSYGGEFGNITLWYSDHNPVSTFMHRTCTHAHFITSTCLFLGPQKQAVLQLWFYFY